MKSVNPLCMCALNKIQWKYKYLIIFQKFLISEATFTPRFSHWTIIGTNAVSVHCTSFVKEV